MRMSGDRDQYWMMKFLKPLILFMKMGYDNIPILS